MTTTNGCDVVVVVEARWVRQSWCPDCDHLLRSHFNGSSQYDDEPAGCNIEGCPCRRIAA